MQLSPLSSIPAPVKVKEELQLAFASLECPVFDPNLPDGHEPIHASACEVPPTLSPHVLAGQPTHFIVAVFAQNPAGHVVEVYVEHELPLRRVYGVSVSQRHSLNPACNLSKFGPVTQSIVSPTSTGMPLAGAELKPYFVDLILRKSSTSEPVAKPPEM